MWLVKGVFYVFLAIFVGIIMSKILKSSKKNDEEKLKKVIKTEKQKEESLEENRRLVAEMKVKVNEKINYLNEKGFDTSAFPEEKETRKKASAFNTIKF